MKNTNNVKSMKGLYTYNGKIVKILSNYKSFKKLTSLQVILEEIEKEYGKTYIKENGLNTPLKLSKFLKNNGVDVVEVIAYFDNNLLSKPIMHYRHTFEYKNALKKIRSYLGEGNNFDDGEYENDLIAFMCEAKEITRKAIKEKLDKFDDFYEKMNNKNTKEEMMREINFVNILKEKIINKFGLDIEDIDDKKELEERWDNFLNKKHLRIYNRNTSNLKAKTPPINEEITNILKKDIIGNFKSNLEVLI